MQAIAGGEYQMIESSKLRKEGFSRSFVRDVDCLPLCFATDTFNRLLNSFRIAGDVANRFPVALNSPCAVFCLTLSQMTRQLHTVHA
jgi:hypothetical protein